MRGSTVIFHQNNKNFIIVEQRIELATRIIRDDNRGFGTGRLHPKLVHLFFSISKHVQFKKLNRGDAGRFDRDEKILKPARFTFNFCFYFLFFIFIILKLIYFIKSTNIINYLLKNIIIIIIIYIKV